ncbi:hypothetical protein [Fusobacterium sp.]|uniref:hypothetical protein n=1 Tax=Fusobacterium sp. TaxID=68766 RepID=UPI0025C4444D|nr:hypothetical protein [Fusobacterium sp.]MCI7223289.1 hypothetical protein [Fusobacterium sp.]
MEKEKVLEIEFKQVWDKWAWRFIKNDTTEIEYHSTDKTNILSIINGILFAIIGDNKKNINEFDMLNDYSKTKLEEFVNEINEKYGIPKRWKPEINKRYYVIDEFLEVASRINYNINFTKRNYIAANCFETREEAEVYAEKFRKILAEREVNKNE